MTSISTRSSVFALKIETTENTPIAPAGATEFIPMQDDFQMSPQFDVLENLERRASIGAADPILGAENPVASGSFYLKHSGVVGTAPNYGPLLQSCLGAVATASTEYNTVASSTTTVIKVDTSEGLTFQRGEALLIKDATNGYRIRCIDSISGDDLTIGFAVPVAPGTGVNLGRATLYYPANTGHPTLTAWEYVGNGGMTKMASGLRVTSANFDISAGETINGNYSLEGLEFYVNPIEITSSTRYLDFTDDDGTFAAVVATGFYNDPHELATALTTAMNDISTGETHTVTYSDTTGKFTILCTGTVLTLKWSTGANTANTIGTKIGFLVAADDSGTVATTGYTSDNAISFAAPYTPSYDSTSPLVAKDSEIMLGSSSADYGCIKASTVSVALATPKANILDICETSGKSGSVVISREVTISVQALIEKYDVRDWKDFREGNNIKFQGSFGVKSGGSWVAGKCAVVYSPTAKISVWDVIENDGVANVTLELKGYVNATGEGEFFINFI